MHATQLDAELDAYLSRMAPTTLDDVPDGFECSVCRRIYEDCFDRHSAPVNGESVCTECMHTCDSCGEWLDDNLAPAVRFRDHVTDGKLSQPTCAACACAIVLADLAGESRTYFDTNDYTREQIDVIVAGKMAVAA